MFTALAEPKRRTILELLASSGQLSASEISSRFPISKPAVSQHLKVLREAKLVDMEKSAQKRLYSINKNRITDFEMWAEKLQTMWTERYDTLEALLKGGIL